MRAIDIDRPAAVLDRACGSSGFWATQSSNITTASKKYAGRSDWRHARVLRILSARLHTALCHRHRVSVHADGLQFVAPCVGDRRLTAVGKHDRRAVGGMQGEQLQ